jgi:hypothetical protein
MKSRVIVSLLLTVAVAGCSLFDEEPEYVYSTASVENVNLQSLTPNTVEFVCETSVGTLCHEFGRTEIKRSGDHITVKVVSRTEKSHMCPQMISTLKVLVRINVEPGMTYTFHFQRWDGTLDETITAPAE